MSDGSSGLKGSMGGNRPAEPMPQPPPAAAPQPPPTAAPQPPSAAVYPPPGAGTAAPPATTGYPAPAPAAGYPSAAPAAPGFVTDQRTNTAVTIIAWVIAVVTLLYMLPWAIAATRGKSNATAIGLVNFLLGWSVIGWIVALVMACGSHNVVAAAGSTNITVVQAGFSGAPQAAPGTPTGYGAGSGPAGPAPYDTTAEQTPPPGLPR